MKKLPAEFAGRKFDAQLLADLPGGVDPCGENGEFHTCVVAGPMFSHRLAVTTGERVQRDGYAYCDLVMEDALHETRVDANAMSGGVG
jgi:diphthamide synthase (EF-2-diphthine--ammonia ligase)